MECGHEPVLDTSCVESTICVLFSSVKMCHSSGFCSCMSREVPTMSVRFSVEASEPDPSEQV